MRLFDIVVVALQLACASALGTRQFKLTLEHNGVCLNIDSVGSNTSISMDFSTTHPYYRTEIPVLVFNYLDLAKVQNVPNYVEFLNQTYSNKNENSSIVAYAETVKFNIQTRGGEAELPESFTYGSAAVYGGGERVGMASADDPDYPFYPSFLDYKVKTKGVYCIYMPRYLWQNDDEELLLLPRPFEAKITVNNEPVPFGVEEDILIYGKISGALGLLTILLYIYHQHSEASIISKWIVRAFMANFAYYAGYLALNLLILVSGENSAIFQTIIKQYARLEGLVVDNISRGVVVAVYVGHGVIYDYGLNFSGVRSKFTAPKITFGITLLLLAVYFSTLLLNHVLVHKDNLNVVALNIENLGFEVFAKSVIFRSSYNLEVLTKSVQDKAQLIYNTSVINVFTTLAILVYTVVTSIVIIRSLSKKIREHRTHYLTLDKARDDKSYLLKPFKLSLVVHLFIYKVGILQVLYFLFLQPLQFTGVFDIAECLSLVGPAISRIVLIKKTIDLSELLVLWLIWGAGNKGLKSSDIKNEKSVDPTTQVESKKNQ